MFFKYKKNKRGISYLLLAIFSLQISYGLLKNSAYHHHDHTQHSQEEEQNPCHRTIFHNDLNQGCNHKNHFGKAVVDCGFCKYYNNSFFELILNQYNISIEFEEDTIDNSLCSYSSAKLIPQVRGPPFYMI
jgi:hypothetical protein